MTDGTSHSRRGSGLNSLSAKLLGLTMIFVMLAEVLIFTPSVARARLIWLEETLTDAYLAAQALEAAGEAGVSMELEDRLLEAVGAIRIDMVTQDGELRMLGAGGAMPAILVDLDDRNPVRLILDAFEALAAPNGRIILMAGTPAEAAHPDIRVEVVFDETPLRASLIDFAFRILALSIIISVITAGLVFVSLRGLLVRPMERFSRTMVAFADDPNNAANIITPSRRGDEIGIAERELQTMQIRLRDAMAQQERLAALGTAVAKVNHDLRNMLATASLVSEGLALSDDPRVQKASPRLFAALDRAVDLCSRTLDYAGGGANPVALAEVPLATIAEAAAAEVRETAADGAEIIVDVPSALKVAVDRAQWERVLINLSRNALQAGATTVRIGAQRLPEGCVDITVVDNGPGMPPRAQENLFRPFAGSAREGGTGLGLAIVKEIVTAHRGEISLARSTAEGTAFAIRLGLASTAADR